MLPPLWSTVLSGEAKFPAAVHDCKAAVRWLRANAVKYGIDPGRIVLVGGSAGAHLAALVATAGPEAKLEGVTSKDISSAVQAAVVIAGPTDTTDEQAAKNSRRPGSNYQLFLGGIIDELPALYSRASPAHWASERTPPMLIFGENSASSYQAIESKLRKLGVRCESFVLTGGIHGEWNREPWFSITMNRIDRFLGDVLKSPAS